MLMMLEELRKQIMSCDKCKNYFKPDPWLFPSECDGCGVKGFLSDGQTEYGRVMFIAYRPSTRRLDKSEIGKKRIELFYKLLRKFGLSNAHLTDLTKCRRSGKFISRVEIKNCLPYLKEEVKIVNPDYLIVVGLDTYHILSFVLELLNLDFPEERISKIRHYAFRRRKSESLEEAYQRFENTYEYDFHSLANFMRRIRT
jgi:uracil-DNA glycosylase family 4